MIALQGVDGGLAVLDRPGSGLRTRRLSDGAVSWQLAWRDLGVEPAAGTPPAWVLPTGRSTRSPRTLPAACWWPAAATD